MSTKKASSKFDTFSKFKCPHCRRGKMFTHPVYNLKKFQEMNRHCPVCNVNFEPEPGFYWGAMYISYGLSVMLSVVIGLSIRIIFGEGLNINVYIASIIAVMVLLVPFSFRLSRAILLHYVSSIKFDPDFLWDGKVRVTRDIIE